MSLLRLLSVLSVLALVSACSVPGPGEAVDGVHDPYEDRNRSVHRFNTGLDSALFSSRGDRDKPPSQVAQDFGTAAVNLSDTLSLPQTVVNQVLQGRLGRASRNTLRFSVNATLGFGGMFDVAGDVFRLPQDGSDFGETLAVWGAPEGAYLVLPVIGPSTQRDAAGRVVDLFTDPLSYVLTPEQGLAATGIKVAGKAAERARFGDTVDSVLHDSADSYVQLRLIYLQNRRFDLGEAAPAAEEIDPLAIDTEGF